MNLPLGAGLYAKATVSRSGNLKVEGKKWPQRADELRRFGKFIVREGVRSYLEIGLHAGLTFRYVGGLLPPGSRMVGVDMDINGRIADLRAAERVLSRSGRYARVLIGDSTATETINQARELGPYDLVLIDGDHTMSGARADWDNYGPMGRIVAFHDVDADNHPKRHPAVAADFAVQKLWRELRPQFRNAEIIGRIKGGGFGILWR